MVQRIEQYDDVLKVILKPTKKFPEGSNYFYTDASARELVEQYKWLLAKRFNNVYVCAYVDGTVYKYHQLYAKSFGVSASAIDHINRVGIDNRDINLNVVDMYQNSLNRPSKGYDYIKARGYFRVQVSHNSTRHFIGWFKSEFDALKAAADGTKLYCTDYKYDFLLDRHLDLDILDDELTGKITSEEATFRHVMRYARDNAWYVYRYGLEEYFQSRGIEIPAFELDSEGYMIHPDTKERLCPFK